MSEQIGLWRATYTPGRWVVLAGPTSLVVMQPAPARASGMVNSFWDTVLAAESIDDLVEKFAGFKIDQMPSFGAFFWAEGQLRTLVRGKIQVIDLASGDEIANGEGVRTWSEVGLGEVRQIRIAMEEVDQDELLQLPLVVGAVTASVLQLDATDQARVSSPQHPVPAPAAVGAVSAETGAADSPSADGAAEAAPDPAELVARLFGDSKDEPSPDSTLDMDQPANRSARAEAPAAAPAEEGPAPAISRVPVFGDQGAAAGAAGLGAAAAGAAGAALGAGFAGAGAAVPGYQGGASVPPAPGPFGQGGSGQGGSGQGQNPYPPGFTPQQPPAGPPGGQPYPQGFVGQQPYAPQPGQNQPPQNQPGQQAYPPNQPGQPPFGPPGQPGQNQGGYAQPSPFGQPGQQAQPGVPAPDPFGEPGDGESLVLAVNCTLGHPNPPEAQRCRRCGNPVQGQQQLVNRPVMALLKPSHGQPVEVDRTVLIGRSPHANRVARERLPRLLTVPSPSNDISRNHIQVSPEGWDLLVTDLHSTNGTALVRPGHPEPERLAPGEPVPVYPGCVLDLGDGITILIDHAP